MQDILPPKVLDAVKTKLDSMDEDVGVTNQQKFKMLLISLYSRTVADKLWGR